MYDDVKDLAMDVMGYIFGLISYKKQDGVKVYRQLYYLKKYILSIYR